MIRVEKQDGQVHFLNSTQSEESGNTSTVLPDSGIPNQIYLRQKVGQPALSSILNAMILLSRE